MSLITYLTRIHFADRVLEDALSEELNRLAGKRPLIVSDALTSRFFVNRLIDALPRNSATATFIISVGRESGIDDRLDSLASEHGADVILAFGDACVQSSARQLATARPGSLPLLAIPTGFADLGLGHAQQRAGPGGGFVLPRAILCDPSLTQHLDADRTAEQGFYALVRCLELFLGTAYNPPADGIALEGLYRAAIHLERAVGDLSDGEARRELMASALNAGLGAQKGLGGIEALTQAIEDECRLVGRHGRLHASVLPQVLAFNAPAVGDRYRRATHAMGLPEGSDLAVELSELGARLRLPHRIGEIGIERKCLRPAADRAASAPANLTNPRHATATDYLTMLESAF